MIGMRSVVKSGRTRSHHVFVWVWIHLKTQIHWHLGYHLRCSAECYDLFLFHRWFYMMHNSILRLSTNTFFSRLAGVQFANCITILPTKRIFSGFHRQWCFHFLKHVWLLLCMNIFHPYVLCFFFILLSQCSPLALGEQSTYIFFASHASPHREFCSSFQRHLRFCLFTRLSFTMYEYVSSPCSVFLLSFYTSVLL